MDTYKVWRARLTNDVDRQTSTTEVNRPVTLYKLVRGTPKQLVAVFLLVEDTYSVARNALDDNHAALDVEERLVIACTLCKTPEVAKLVNAAQGTILSMKSIDVPSKKFVITYEIRVISLLPAVIFLYFGESFHSRR